MLYRKSKNWRFRNRTHKGWILNPLLRMNKNAYPVNDNRFSERKILLKSHIEHHINNKRDIKSFSG